MARPLARELLTSFVVEHRTNYRWEKEGQLIAQIVAGRKDLFTALIEPHRAPLFRLIRAKLGNDFESDDVIQQTILKAFTRLGQFRFEASFRTWLIRIALNEVVQWHRKRLSTRLLVLDHSALAQLPIADQTASPLKQCERREAAGLFRKAYAMLPGKISGYDPAARSGASEHCRSSEAVKHDRCGGKDASPAGAATNGEPPHASRTRSHGA